MEIFTILAGIKSGLAAGRTIASMSKQIGEFFDQTDQAKKAYSKKRGSNSSVGSESLARWADLQQKAAAEEELRTYIVNSHGLSKWHELLRIRKEVLQEKREAEAQARRDAIQRQELIITLVGIGVLLVFTFVGSSAYLHYMGWIDVMDWFP